MPLMWKRAKRRQLPWLGSNLPPSTETLVIACCVNKSVQNPSQIRTNPTQIWGTECRLGGWSRDTWGHGPHKRCHCGTVQDVSQEECLTRGWNYDRPWGSLLREKGNLRWEGLRECIRDPMCVWGWKGRHIVTAWAWEGLQSEDSFRFVGETGVRFGLLVVGMGLWSGWGWWGWDGGWGCDL